MSNSLRQVERVGELNTPLGKDELALARFECTEGVSEKFVINIDAVGNQHNINLDSAIGQNCTITLHNTKDEKRYFCGVLTEARWLGGDDKGLQNYKLVLRPWLWLLSYRRNSFIHHDKTVPEIIEAVFGEHDFAAYTNNLSRSYPTLEYCVQYRETDMDFVCRLMEEYGISYYFQHSDGEHRLIMTDEMSTFETISGKKSYFRTADLRHAKDDYFNSFALVRSFTSGKIKVDDYYFENSDADQMVSEEVSPPFHPQTLEIFDYPGRYVNTGDGRKIAQAWRDMERSKDHHYHAEGDCASCFPGGLLTLEDKSKSGLDGEYLALRAHHKFAKQGYRTGTVEQGPAYQGRYEFIKSDKTYAPPRITPKAVIPGHQTAKVVGDGDIDVDEYGRILVRFHWDQEQDQSRRCRVAQVWAGNRWGGIFTPRVGMEVLVAFLEGDPDQPYVVGALYNDKHMPPYDLPGEKTISGFKSNSTTSGSGYNEFVFDDEDNNQLVRLHAERNLEAVVENDETRTVRKNRNTEIEQNDTLHVTQVLKITADVKIEITCGSSKITMDPAKITMESPSIDIKGLADLKTDGLMATHSAGAVMTIKGPFVKIN